MNFTAKLYEINKLLNDIVWGPPMLILIVGCGIYLTIITKFIQAGKFGYMWKNTIATVFKKGKGSGARKSDGKNVSPFQAVSTALASTAGVGNVAGVAGAVAAGGAGALFWMWMSAFFGMATKYAEIVLAVHYRQTGSDGSYYGGPMYYIEKGLNMKWLAIIFSVFGGLCCFGIGNATQASEISVAVQSLCGEGFDSSLVTALVLAGITAVAMLGGIRRIGTITSYLVPVMSVIYVIGGAAIIIMNFGKLPAAFTAILSEAFSFEAVGGGILGTAIVRSMRFGVARGVFSNEAGLGSAPIAHAASSTQDPVYQGLWGVFEVFLDTIVICTITGLVIVISGLYGGGLTGGALTAASFDLLIPFGGHFVRIAIVLFALATILGWSYYGERCWGYLTKNSKAANLVFRLAYITVAFIGAASSSNAALGAASALELMWSIADTLNGLMALPNLAALLLLSGVVIKLTDDHFRKQEKKTGKRLS